MFGIPIQSDAPTHVFCDNQVVVNNCSNIESTLNKKHVSIAYHLPKWAATAGEICVGWINTEFNLAYALTKKLSKDRRQFLFWN